MTGAPGILLLAEAAAGDQLASRLGAGRASVHADPYDALEAMERRDWPVVVIAAPRAEFAGLCRAARRLQPEAKLVALCAPSAEPEARLLLGEALDEYMIDPATRADLAALAAAAAEPQPEGRPAEPVPSPARIAGLVASAEAPESLERHLAELVSGRLDVPVRWTSDDEAGGLLRIEGATARTLRGDRDGVALTDSQRGYLAALQEVVGALAATAERTKSLERLATTDHLTGAYNRRYFYRTTDQILGRAREQGFHVTVLLYDIDDFKRYNDTYGHGVGDEILRQTAALMKRTTREQDIVARIGGDEFAVLFWDTDEPREPDSHPPETAYALANRFRQAVENHEFPSLGPVAKGVLSISGGLATFPWEGRSCRDLLTQADAALRAAKAAGKNRIYLVGQATANGVPPRRYEPTGQDDEEQ